MSQDKVLLLGATGYVGTAFRAMLEKRGVDLVCLSRSQADYSRPGVLLDFLLGRKFSFLVNCAGYTGKPNVDACEDHRWETLMGNAVLPGILRDACEARRLPWGQVSSGCIYLGRRSDGGGFTETDPPNFCFRSGICSFYSGTKALGEEVLDGAPQCYLWRLRIPFNEVDSPRNYLSKLMSYERLLQAENSISQLDEFVEAAWACWEKRVPFGVYNVTNPGVVTTREIAEQIKVHGLATRDFVFFQNESEFMRCAARAPRSSCVLSTAKLEAAGIRMTKAHEAVDRALRRWRKA